MINRLLLTLSSLDKIDRRLIYLVLFFAISISLFADISFKDQPSELIIPIYDYMENLEPGIPVLMSLEYSPTSEPELAPMAKAVSYHALQTGHPICYMSLWPEGGMMINRLTDQLVHTCPDAVYGKQWVNLGFKVGGEMVINSMRDSLQNIYASDVFGNSLNEIPLLRNVKGLSDFGMVFSFSGGSPGLKEWILYAGDELDIPLAGGCKGVGAPQFLPYFPDQIIGLFNGLKGASEYESALIAGGTELDKNFLRAISKMGPQTFAHLVIILLLLLGNISTLAVLINRRLK
jgi:hypothetical protein